MSTVAAVILPRRDVLSISINKSALRKKFRAPLPRVSLSTPLRVPVTNKAEHIQMNGGALWGARIHPFTHECLLLMLNVVTGRLATLHTTHTTDKY